MRFAGPSGTAVIAASLLVVACVPLPKTGLCDTFWVWWFWVGKENEEDSFSAFRIGNVEQIFMGPRHICMKSSHGWLLQTLA